MSNIFAKNKDQFKLILMIFLASLFLVFFGQNFALVDFSIYWKATDAFLKNFDPYDLPHTMHYLTGEYGLIVREDSPILKMWGPPIVFPIMLPFGFISLKTAKTVYLITLASSLVLCVKLLLDLVFYNKKTNLNFFTFSIILLIVSFWIPLILFSGNINWISLLGITLFLYLYRKGFFFLSGLSLFLCFIKIHTLFLFFLYIFALSFLKKRFSFFQGFALAVFLNSILIALINPTSFSNFAKLDVTIPFSAMAYCSSYAAFLINYFGITGSPGFMFFSYLISLIIVIILFLNKKYYDSFNTFYIVLFISSITSPYIWDHDYIVTLPTIIFVSAEVFILNPKSFLHKIVLSSIFLISTLTFHPILQETLFRFPDRRMINLFLLVFLPFGLLALKVWHKSLSKGTE